MLIHSPADETLIEPSENVNIYELQAFLGIPEVMRFLSGVEYENEKNLTADYSKSRYWGSIPVSERGQYGELTTYVRKLVFKCPVR